MDASGPTHKKQRADAGPSGPGDCNLPPDRFLDVLLAGEDDDAPIAVVAACMRTRDLGLTLAGATGSLRDALRAVFKRWDAQGDRFRTAVAELKEKKAAARATALLGEDAASFGAFLRALGRLRCRVWLLPCPAGFVHLPRVCLQGASSLEAQLQAW